MGKFVHDDIYDLPLAAIADNGTRMFLCSAQPTTWTEALTTYNLASKTLVTGNGNGVYTIANGSVSGRKLTVAQQTGITVTAAGTATHVAICGSGNEAVILVTTITSLACQVGATVTVNAFTYTLPDVS